MRKREMGDEGEKDVEDYVGISEIRGITCLIGVG